MLTFRLWEMLAAVAATVVPIDVPGWQVLSIGPQKVFGEQPQAAAIPSNTGFRSGSVILGALLWMACSLVCTGGKCYIGGREARGDPGQGAPLSIVPGEDIQARVNTAPPRATFLLKSGLHRMQSIVPRNGDTFTGETGTVLSGARLLTTLVRSGSTWQLAPGQMQLGRKAADEAPCRDGNARCNFPNDLFIDDVPLLHMAKLSDVGPGKWHFDDAADRIHLGDDPTGRRVEVSVTPRAFTGLAANVTIRNLTIEKYASPTQQAAVELGTAWTIEDCEVRWNHFTGIALGPRATSRRNHVHHNGCFGFHGAGEHILVASNEIAYNGYAGYDPFWGVGGSKWVHTSHLIVRDNFSHHNRGPGLWTDIDNIHALYENNRVEDNERGGILHEISYDATIRGNTLRRNGTGKHFPYWTTGAGIEIVSSRNVEVCRNTLEDNWQGITGLDDHRGTGNAGPYTLINLNVHDNTVTSRLTDAGGGRTGIIDTKGSGAFSAAANNRFAQNTYSLGAKRQCFFWLGKELDESEWHRRGQDVPGSSAVTADSSPNERNVRIAGIVLKWIRADKEANFRRAERMIRQAAAGGAQIVCTTECFLDGYAIADKSIALDVYRSLGEPIPDGAYFKRLADLARELKIVLVAGMLEADGDARCNAAVLISADGALLGKYRKQHLEHELVRNRPGTTSPVFETPYGRVGLLICADRRLPEIAERLKRGGAEFLLCPSGGMFGAKSNDWILQARSRETGLPIVFVHPAEFLVTGRDGAVLQQTILGNTLLIAPADAGTAKDANRVVSIDLRLPPSENKARHKD